MSQLHQYWPCPFWSTPKPKSFPREILRRHSHERQNYRSKPDDLCYPFYLSLTYLEYIPRSKNVTVEPLRISEANLNTRRMLDLMAVSRGDGRMPLYLHAVYRILREMRIEQQETGAKFNYETFQQRVARTDMTPLSSASWHSDLTPLKVSCRAHR